MCSVVTRLQLYLQSNRHRDVEMTAAVSALEKSNLLKLYLLARGKKRQAAKFDFPHGGFVR